MPHGMTGRRFLRHLALDGATRYLDASRLFHDDEIPTLFTRDVIAEMAGRDVWDEPLSDWREPGGDWLAAAQYHDINRYLPLDILTKVDRMTMAHSIEARPPLLDHRLVEFAATIPARFRLRDGTTKYLFKQAMRGMVPDTIIDRRKHGFAVPLAQWFRGDLAGFARDVLLSTTCRERGVLEPRLIERVLRLNARGRDLDLQIWTMLSFELWCRRFLDGPSAVDVVSRRSSSTTSPVVLAPATP